MRLSEREFRGMNNPVRRFFQRTLEYPLFKRMGFVEEERDILEIGCGSGYGAELLAQLRPKSYVGVDVMPEQVELAQARAAVYGLQDYRFLVKDATHLDCVPDGSKDVIVIFGILHHIPTQWRDVVQECYRVLRKGGKLFVEEPDGSLVEKWDRVFQWGHPDEVSRFRLPDFERYLAECGFIITKKFNGIVFGVYSVQK
jgi:SAM-dependent methyltransferase